MRWHDRNLDRRFTVLGNTLAGAFVVKYEDGTVCILTRQYFDSVTGAPAEKPAMVRELHYLFQWLVEAGYAFDAKNARMSKAVAVDCRQGKVYWDHWPMGVLARIAGRPLCDCTVPVPSDWVESK